MRNRSIGLAAAAVCGALASVVAAPLAAETLVPHETRVTVTPPLSESTPIVGQDATSAYVVYASRDFTSSPTPNAAIYWQRFDSHGLRGTAEPVSWGGTREHEEETCGTFAVDRSCSSSPLSDC